MDENVILYKSQAMYGATNGSSPHAETLGGTRLVYCIHGKVNGCCNLSEGEFLYSEKPTISDVSNIIDIQPERSLHCHRERPKDTFNSNATKKLMIASSLCFIFMVAEIIGGVLSGSLAIATDAAHLLTDLASFMISLFSIWVASRRPTRRLSFGWYRAEVIGALTSVLLIWVVTAVLVMMAVERIQTMDFKIDSVIMLISSGIGVLINLIMGFSLHQHGHTHGGGSSHSHDENINVRAAFIHVVGDFIQSVGVFIAALVIYFKPTWIIVDPICTFLFSILVLITTFTIIRDTVMVLMEGKPKGFNFAKVLESFLEIEGVVRVHNLRIWALSLDKTALSAHLVINQNVSPQHILREASNKLHSRFELFEMTLQIEEFVSNMEDCTQCECPEK